MRTFNGLQIFTNQLTNSGQLDLRYVQITGSNTIDGLKTFTSGISISPGNNVPTGQNAAGIPGQIVIGTSSASFGRGMYICVEPNTWYFIPLIGGWSS
jgi:hypothetical protein